MHKFLRLVVLLFCRGSRSMSRGVQQCHELRAAMKGALCIKLIYILGRKRGFLGGLWTDLLQGCPITTLHETRLSQS